MVLAEDLRQAVLQAALQGKLTEQLATDSDVDEMLISIQEEKEKLVADKIIKKEKSLSEIQDEDIPFEIPANWRWVRLQSFLDVRDGTHDSPKYVEKGIPFVTSKNLNNGKIDFSDVKYITKEDADFFNARSKVDKNDILMAMIGSIGKPVLVEIEEEFAIKNMALFKPVPKSNVNMNYVLLLLGYAEKIMKMQSTGGVQKFVSLTYLREFISPLPPIEEQQRIVDKINEIMPKIDEYEKIEKELEALKKAFPADMKDALLQAAMQGKLTEQLESDSNVDELLISIQKEKEELIAQKKIKKEKTLSDIAEEEIPFEIPDNWRWEKVGNICDCGAGATPTRGDRSFYDGGTICWLKTGELTDGYIYQCEEKVTQTALEKCSLRINKIGDILIAMYGATIGKLGIVTFPLTTNQACCGCSPYKGIYNLYLFYYFMSAKKVLIGKAEGGAQPNISREKIRNSLIPIPPIEEQQRIVERLDALLPLCEDL
ncbi:MAG: restriction endonuclease subunit S [Eubacterium sp.]|nr:restriction endonuclease subunit S [Eubacterium sp.]